MKEENKVKETNWLLLVGLFITTLIIFGIVLLDTPNRADDFVLGTIVIGFAGTLIYKLIKGE